MRTLRALAASKQPLRIAIVDAIRAVGGSFARRSVSYLDRYEDQLSLDLEPEDGDGPRVETPPPLHPADATAAVLLGRAFDGCRDVLGRLRDPDMVALIEVPTPDLVQPIQRVLRKFVLGNRQPVLDAHDLHGAALSATIGAAIVFAPSYDAKPGKSSHDDADLAHAIQLRASVIGVTANHKDLPQTLLDLAEHRIVVDAIDAEVVSEVIAAVTGKRPRPIDEQVGRRATIQMLSIAVRADLGARRSLARLERLMSMNHRKADDGPLLSEMHGLGEARERGLEMVAALRAYASGKQDWADCSKGLLISGPPGTGKTSIARAMAREAGVNFVATSYAAWQSHLDGTMGAVTKAMRKTFADLKSPGIMFIDEVDAIPARGSGGRHDTWFTAINACLLECLDGFERREGIVVVAACNDPSKLDPALVRAGRLDQHVIIRLPDVPALAAIFRMHLGHDLAGADLRNAALAARGHTGADVERWVRIARQTARTAARRIELQDLLDAVCKGKPELPTDLRRRFAYHEAGHAILHRLLGTAEPISLAIGADGGVTESELGALRANTRAELEQFLVAILGGRAAEEVVFSEATAGSAGSPHSDLARANRIALRLETQYGFGDLGLVSLSGAPTDEDLLRYDWLRHAVRATIDRAYAAAIAALERNRVALDALALALFDAGYLDRNEIEQVLSRFTLDHGPAEQKSTSSPTAPPTPATPAGDTVLLPSPDDLVSHS